MIYAGMRCDPVQLFALMTMGSSSTTCLAPGLAPVPVSSHSLCTFIAVMMMMIVSNDGHEYMVLHTAYLNGEGRLPKNFLFDDNA